MALAAALFLLLGTCALSYFAWQQRDSLPDGPELPTATVIAESTVAAGEETGSATATLGLAATATIPSVATQPQATYDNVVAMRRAAPPTIDGDGAGWSDLPIYSSPHIVFTHRDWDGSDDLEATWQIAWDDQSLYLLAVVRDDVHVQTQSGRTAYLGDSVELQIDTARMNSLRSTLDPNTFQISLSPGDFATIPPSAWRFQGTSDGQMLDAPGALGALGAPGAHNIQVAARRNEEGYILEAAIPWRDLNVTPAAGLVIGLAVNFNDNDTPGTAVQEMMKSNAPNRQFRNPATWGTLRLE